MKTITINPEDNLQNHPLPTLSRRDGYWLGQFPAMASPCSILMDGIDETAAEALLRAGATEAWRIERKFSRYTTGNVIDRINRSCGKPIEVDEETARLLDYSDHCYRLSNGKFDVTSGVLRKIWRFDGSDRLPNPQDIENLLPSIGWEKIAWNSPNLTLPEGMEVDLGGIGKEYAVDRCLGLLEQHLPSSIDRSLLINFGGDLACSGARPNGDGWKVGVEDHQAKHLATQALTLKRGALATSGDSHRFLLRDGIRYGHILDPQTGWPVSNAPHSITVAADTCTLAGMLATFAMLQGPDAESFLNAQRVQYWIQRD